MKIAIITAMSEEYRVVAGTVGNSTRKKQSVLAGELCDCYGHEFLLVESGMGFDNAARAAETIIREWIPDLLISTGFCGGIAPGLLVGDVIIAKNILIANRSVFEEIPVRFSAIGQNFAALQEAEGERVFGGTFISSVAITSKKRLAGMLSGEYPNPVVEMESGAIAIIAAEKNIPLLAIRVVSDAASEELKFALDEISGPDKRRIRIHLVLRTIMRKPHIIPQLVRLAFSSRTAARSLTAALSRLFRSL